ncbi:hypothetical protein Ciccas_010594 [Cichlidogyrus casuarinus]|uniref:Uncharacterized protein n=1 Tax=Cichlidogyrus casuarinus TaxID=1844966 RepID=A0ABD2PU90_9PLAT
MNGVKRSESLEVYAIFTQIAGLLKTYTQLEFKSRYSVDPPVLPLFPSCLQLLALKKADDARSLFPFFRSFSETGPTELDGRMTTTARYHPDVLNRVVEASMVQDFLEPVTNSA